MYRCRNGHSHNTQQAVRDCENRQEASPSDVYAPIVPFTDFGGSFSTPDFSSSPAGDFGGFSGGEAGGGGGGGDWGGGSDGGSCGGD